MHNIAEGFDGGTNAEFVKFLRYAQRSCTEVKSQLYVALDRRYITQVQFDHVYDQADKAHAKIGGFIRYLLSPETKNHLPIRNQEPRTKNQEPRTKN
jgi:four helix bundle protein